MERARRLHERKTKDKDPKPPKCECLPMLRKSRDTVPANDRRTFWKWMFPVKEICISNFSDYKGYVIISPTQESDISTVNIPKVGGVKYENNGVTIQKQSKGVAPGVEEKFSLETKRVYVTVFIQVCKDEWVCWRENICVNAYRDNFVIKNIKDAELDDVFGARYTHKEFMELLKKKVST